MVTLKDIAKKAGVTPATVSMALNGKGSISDGTRKRIERIAKEMGYYPSATAKALRTNMSKTLGIIVGSLRNEFFMDIIYAVEEYAAKKGYIIFVCDAERSSEKVVSSLKALAARGVDGILISLGFYPDKAMSGEICRLVDEGIKVLSFTSAIDLDCVPLVEPSESEIYFSVVDDLIALGHRNIGVLTAPEGAWLHDTRFQLIRKALEANGLFDGDLVGYSEMNSEAGEAAACQLLSSKPEITALICCNDLVAVGAIKASGRLGLAIPSDISIIGCDGVPLSQLISPRLTTISMPRHDMGARGCQSIIEMIEDAGTQVPHRTLIGCTLINGETLGKARGQGWQI